MSFRLVLPPPVSFSEDRAVTRLETLNWIDCSNNNGTCNLYTISTVVQGLFGQKHYIQSTMKSSRRYIKEQKQKHRVDSMFCVVTREVPMHGAA